MARKRGHPPESSDNETSARSSVRMTVFDLPFPESALRQKRRPLDGV
jgi:hypothetical protein